MVNDTEVGAQKLRIIEWKHLDLFTFYPMALTASWTVRGLLYPLNVVKSRLQLQKQNNVYSGMRHAFSDILRSEGLVALYRGFWITLPQLSASLLYSTIYEKSRYHLHVNSNTASAAVVSALAGGFAATFNQVLFVPSDIISQHMMIHNNPGKFSDGARNLAVSQHLHTNQHQQEGWLTLRTIKAIYHVDGVLGFYRGFLSCLVLYIPMTMVFWFSYYKSLAGLKKVRATLLAEETHENLRNGKTHENLLLIQAVSGAIGGICSAIVTNPLDVMRIRVQVHRTNYKETIRHLHRFEGWYRVFTKGLAPRMINNGIYSCLIMIGYEVIKRLCVLPEYRDAIVW